MKSNVPPLFLDARGAQLLRQLQRSYPEARLCQDSPKRRQSRSDDVVPIDLPPCRRSKHEHDVRVGDVRILYQ